MYVTKDQLFHFERSFQLKGHPIALSAFMHPFGNFQST